MQITVNNMYSNALFFSSLVSIALGYSIVHKYVSVYLVEVHYLITITLSLTIVSIIAVIFSILLKNKKALLYLQIRHEKNQLSLLENDGQYSEFLVLRASKANALGVWLYLASVDIEDAPLRRLFIGCWQTNQRSFRALHRHIKWYTL